MAFQWSVSNKTALLSQTAPGGTVVQMTETTSTTDANLLQPGHLDQVWNSPRD